MTPPIKPSTVFFGLKFGAIFVLPKYFPANIPPISQALVTNTIHKKVNMHTPSPSPQSFISRSKAMGKEKRNGPYTMLTMEEMMLF
jgi:hypothetical protein